MNGSIKQIDPKYKFIIEKKIDNSYYKMIDWVNLNSKRSVNIFYEQEKNENLTGSTVYWAFEDEDDFLLFKIKYPNKI